jgi:hypothetical protein
MKKYDNSWEEYAGVNLNLDSSRVDGDLLTNNSLIESLKESIKFNVKSLKYNKSASNNCTSKANTCNKSISNKTEKEKLKEYYNSIYLLKF